jgi:hypothetical protein
MSWPGRVAVVVGLILLAALAATPAQAKAPRWTERQAEEALLSRAHVSYADCVPLMPRGRRFLCLIEYTDGGEWYLVLVPRRDGYAVRDLEPA